MTEAEKEHKILKLGNLKFLQNLKIGIFRILTGGFVKFLSTEKKTIKHAFSGYDR